MLQRGLLSRLPPQSMTVVVLQQRLGAGAPAETTWIGATHGQIQAVAEIAPTLLAVPPHVVMTGNRTETSIGRRGKGAASRVKVTAAEAEETQVTIRTTSRRVTTTLVTTRSEGNIRAKIRVETRARNVVAKVATPHLTVLTPPRPLTLTPGRLTIVIILDIGLLESVNAHLRVLRSRR